MKNMRYIAGALAALLAAAVLLILCAAPARAYEGEPIWTKRMEALHEAADLLRAAGFTDDSEAIQALSAAWWSEKNDLDIVARVVMGEAGYCPPAHQVAVAAVVCNRVESPYFPNAVTDVVAQQGQYTTEYLRGFERTLRCCYEAAKIAMDGESGVPEDVIWQAEFRQGAEVWWISEVNTGWYASTTYFCRGVA